MSTRSQDLAMLETWGPYVLAQGKDASKSSLLEIIRCRSRLEFAALNLDSSIYLDLIRIDQKCSPECHNLLYLDFGTVLSEMESPPSVRWCGVHLWPVCSYLEGWASQLSSLSFRSHPSEVLRGVLDLSESTPLKYFNHAFYTEEGKWLPTLGRWELEFLAQKITERRL